MKPLFISDKIYLEHDIPNHSESKERLIDILKEIERIKDDLNFISPSIATKEHYENIKRACEYEEYLDSDTFAVKGSFNAALYRSCYKGYRLIATPANYLQQARKGEM